MQDKIEREIIIKAPKEQVYAAIADPAQITSWFPDVIEGELQEGEQPVFVFAGHGKAQTYVEAMQPYEYFAFRWIPGGSDFLGDVRTVPNTLVEFHIEDLGDTCKVKMTESGFASLPPEMAEASFKQNDGGWTFMLDRLDTHFKG
jgi:uncharacterized protein YndB with AHSA1/START domain